MWHYKLITMAFMLCCTAAQLATRLCTQERDYAERTHDNRFKPAVLGLALVDGYDALGLRLARPELRQAQEADCKKVARGQVELLYYNIL
jgi:DNA topoisomerase IA